MKSVVRILVLLIIPTLIAGGEEAMTTPQVSYSTYFGGSDRDNITGCALSPDAEWLFVGRTASTNFPTEEPFIGKYQGGSWDGFLSWLDPKGEQIRYSSYLGGSGSDYPQAVFVTDDLNIYVAGSTYSSNFPMGPQGYATNYIGGEDVFVIKFGKDAKTVLAATYFGGTGNDSLYGATMDRHSNLYLVGKTTSTNLPVHNALQTNYGTHTDGFFLKLDSELTNLCFASYFGGDDYDWFYDVAVDEISRDIWLVGSTDSTNFPLTNNFLDITLEKRMGFVSQVASNGTELLFSTYLGGSSGSYAYAVAVNTGHCGIVGGYTSSPDFPVTNAVQSQYCPVDTNVGARGDYNAFLTMFTAQPTSLVFSTYLGGSSYDAGKAVDCDEQGRIYLYGYTASSNFPTTGNAYQPLHSQDVSYYFDFFVSVFTPDGTGLLYSTYYGDDGDEYQSCMARDGYGAVYLAGYNDSGDGWPVTNALYPARPGDEDGAIVKFVEPYMDFSGLDFSVGSAACTWFTDSRNSVRLEYADDPCGAWAQLGSYSNIPSTGGSVTITDNTGAASIRLYRLRPSE